MAVTMRVIAQSGPQLNVARDGMDDCTSSLDLTITVSSDKPVDIRRLVVKLPSAYTHEDRDASTEIDIGDQRDVNPDLDRTFEQHYDALAWYFGLWPISFHKTLSGIAQLEYRDAVSGVTRTMTQPFALPVEAPMSAVFVGGVIGVGVWLLLAFGFRKPLTFRGTALALAITLLALACARFSATNVLPLPIAVELKDSFAGFVVGLLWPTLQKGLVSKVFAPLR
jgi:hypothetical protein